MDLSRDGRIFFEPDSEVDARAYMQEVTLLCVHDET
jgi:hypothetical protein